jgi:hypothetical protein
MRSHVVVNWFTRQAAATAVAAFLLGGLAGWLLWGHDHTATPRVIEGWAIALSDDERQIIYHSTWPTDDDGRGFELSPFYSDQTNAEHPVNRSCLKPQHATRVKIGVINVHTTSGSSQAVSWVQCLSAPEPIR